MDIWHAANRRLKQRDPMGARGILLEAKGSVCDEALTNFAATVVTNYQSIVMKTNDAHELSVSTLVPEIHDSNTIDMPQLLIFHNERDRLKEQFEKTREDESLNIAFHFHQVLSSLAILDGLRTFLWSKRLISAIERTHGIDEDIYSFQNYVSDALYETLEGSTFSNTESSPRRSGKWKRSAYEGIELIRQHMLQIDISHTDYDSFLLLLSEELGAHTKEVLH